ncbi:MAG: hypothetical protein ACI94Y_004376 [Maribacter sp.]|jgi:hypothetical protein
MLIFNKKAFLNNVYCITTFSNKVHYKLVCIIYLHDSQIVSSNRKAHHYNNDGLSAGPI